jgi:DNA packaging protein, QLRG family
MMAEETLKAMIKTNIESSSDMTISEDVVNTFFQLSKNAILLRRYPFVQDVSNKALPSMYDSLCVRLAVYMYNKQGAEGEISHTENGVSIKWENGDLPESLMSEIIPMSEAW